MDDQLPDLRRWLKALSPEDARLLADHNEGIRQLAKLAHNMPARRAAMGIQVWASRASVRDLKSVAEHGVLVARGILARRGWGNDELNSPDREQLTGMMASLEPPLAVLTVFGLLLGNFPASDVAIAARDDLFEAARADRTAAVVGADRRQVEEDDVDDQNTDTNPDGDEIRAGLLISQARQAGDALNDAANGVGMSDFSEAMAAFEESRELLQTHLASMGIAWNAADGFDAAERGLAERSSRQRAEEAERRKRESERKELVSQRERLLDALARDVTPDLRIAFERKIEAIDAVLGAGAVVAEPTGSTCEAPEPLEPSAPETAAAVETGAAPKASTTPRSTDTTRKADAPTPSAAGRPIAITDVAVPQPATQSEPRIGATAEGPSAETGVPTSQPPVREQSAATPYDDALCRFVAAGRFDEAHYLTMATMGPGSRATALAYAAAAFRCTGEAQAEAVEFAFDERWHPDGHKSDPVADAVAVLAASRISRDIAWTPAVLAGRSSGAVTGAGAFWWRLADAQTEAVRQGIRGPVDRLDTDDRDRRRELLAKQAEDLIEQLPKRTVKYQRATQVLRHLARGVVEATLRGVLDWCDGRISDDELAVRVAHWRGSTLDEHIEQADHALSVTVKDRIEAGARQTLLQRLGEVNTVVATALAMADDRTPGGGSEADVREALADLEGEVPPPGAEYAALALLRDWLLGTEPVVAGVVPADDPLRPDPTPLLAAPELWQRGAGPQLDAAVIAALCEARDVDGLLAEYAARDEVGLGRRLLAAVLQGVLRGVPMPDPEQAKELRQRIDRYEQDSEARREAALQEVSDLAARMQSLGLTVGTEAEVEGRIQALDAKPADGSYRRVLDELAEIGASLRAVISLTTDGIRREVESKRGLSVEVKARITQLLDASDAVAARELLTIVENGGVLPPPTQPGGVDLKEFVGYLAAVEQEADNGPAPDKVRWFAERAAAGAKFDTAVDAALSSWDALAVPSVGQVQQDLPAVLRVLGLECRGPDITTVGKPPTGIKQFKVRLRPPGDGYLAAFGSLAPSNFTVFVVTNPTSMANPLKIVADWPDAGPAIVLCMGLVRSEGRAALLAASRRRAAEFLVVDAAVFGWVAARSPQSFRALQRVTLPWTGMNPYTPFAAGSVPPEVFHGRTNEMRDIVDPLGPKFVYGGRQLGKSAMLRRVADDFARGDEQQRVAVYVDLKSKGIGEVEPADRLWRVLADELRRRGVIGAKIGENAGPQVIAKTIDRWLRGDADRRILVLADEADAFLTADYRDTISFRTYTALQGLINETSGRFKVVFAGLHQVQRFVVPNGSVVHGGVPICVGPLDAAAARRLIVEPLAAVGFVFGDDADRLVWRIHAHTNGQASLLQLFCDTLVRQLAAREDPSVPCLITEADVDLAAHRVGPMLADRLRFTINLQDRYRLLMLILALKGIDDGYSRGYRITELLDEARVWWPEGMSQTTVDELDITMTEMVGLGVVVRRGERSYAVRSPNLVARLGSREELEAELAAESFDSPYEYDPNVARRTLAQSDVRRFMSPLTERDLGTLFSPGFRVVMATTELGADRLEPALKKYAEAPGLGVERRADEAAGPVVEWIDAQRLPVRLADVVRRKAQPAVLAVDARRAGPATIEDLVQQITGYVGAGERCAVLLVSPAQATVKGLAGQPRRFARWNQESLRSWPDCLATNAAERADLIDATGGWPDHVELVLAKAESGTPLNTVLEEWIRSTSTPDEAREHIRRAEIESRQLESLRRWVDYVDGPEPEADIVAVLADDDDPEDGRTRLMELENLGLLDRHPDGIAVNPATCRAVRALAVAE